MREYSRLEVGYDFTDGSIERVIPKKTLTEEEKEIRKGKAKNTSEMLLFAIERSGSGPPKGIMNLKEDDSGGTAAFLRAVKNYTHVVFPPDYDDVFANEDDRNRYLVKIERKVNKTSLVKPQQAQATDGPYKICKSSVSPLVLFLHVDQGLLENGGYTPFASPICNSRSVHKKHVDGVCQEVVQGHSIISQEDFAILGYQVLVDGYESEQEEATRTGNGHGQDDTTGEGLVEEPIAYRCTLNRDSESDDTIVAKDATVVTMESMRKIFWTVSNILGFVHSTQMKTTLLSNS
jgi:hypothetical protein